MKWTLKNHAGLSQDDLDKLSGNQLANMCVVKASEKYHWKIPQGHLIGTRVSGQAHGVDDDDDDDDEDEDDEGWVTEEEEEDGKEWGPPTTRKTKVSKAGGPPDPQRAYRTRARTGATSKKTRPPAAPHRAQPQGTLQQGKNSRRPIVNVIAPTEPALHQQPLSPYEVLRKALRSMNYVFRNGSFDPMVYDIGEWKARQLHLNELVKSSLGKDLQDTVPTVMAYRELHRQIQIGHLPTREDGTVEKYNSTVDKANFTIEEVEAKHKQVRAVLEARVREVLRGKVTNHRADAKVLMEKFFGLEKKTAVEVTPT